MNRGARGVRDLVRDRGQRSSFVAPPQSVQSRHNDRHAVAEVYARLPHHTQPSLLQMSRLRGLTGTEEHKIDEIQGTE